MSSPRRNPFIRYAMGLGSAAVLAFVAFAFLDGTVQLLVYGMAALGAVSSRIYWEERLRSVV